jgi:hypothetical protein
VPLEVKSAENLSSKSLVAFIEKTGISLAIKASMRDYRHNEVIVNLPLYEVGQIDSLISNH